MENIPNLEELLKYGEECQYPDLILSDYFRIDNKKKNENKQQNNNQSQDDKNQKQNKQPQEQASEQQKDSQQQEDTNNQQDDSQLQENTDNQQDEQGQELNPEQQKDSQLQEDTDNQQDKQGQEHTSEPQDDSQPQKDFEEQQKKQDNEQHKDENDFDDLINNYDDNINKVAENTQSNQMHSASDKINDISTTKIYKVLKKLVSISYETYQKGTYKYAKKEIIKHYITNQKFKIMDDLLSPTFKPDVYVFDLSPSNNESLELYVNAISSVAIKDSLIYLTYNECILRKLLIKKGNAQNIDVSKIVNSETKSYNNLECTIFREYRSLYEELKDIKDRKIYIFSDFDISVDISELSQENPSIVWFCTEKKYTSYRMPYRDYPSSYIGYYVETSWIEDIEKFIEEKNKNKYKGMLK